jgi:hypothetical protein
LPKEDFIKLITEPGKDEEIEKIDKGRQEREDEEERDGGQGQLNATLRITEEQRSAAIKDIIRFAIEPY